MASIPSRMQRACISWLNRKIDHPIVLMAIFCTNFGAILGGICDLCVCVIVKLPWRQLRWSRHGEVAGLWLITGAVTSMNEHVPSFKRWAAANSWKLITQYDAVWHLPPLDKNSVHTNLIYHFSFHRFEEVVPGGWWVLVLCFVLGLNES